MSVICFAFAFVLGVIAAFYDLFVAHDWVVACVAAAIAFIALGLLLPGAVRYVHTGPRA